MGERVALGTHLVPGAKAREARGAGWVKRLLLVFVFLGACGGGPARPDYPTPEEVDGEAPRTKPAPPPPAPPTRTTKIGRAQLDAFLAPGPGALLAKVRVAAATKNGKFHGWRILSLPPDTTVELQVGDVVLGVNGQGLERPEHLAAVWEKLRGTSEVVVDYEREGEARTWRLPVVE